MTQSVDLANAINSFVKGCKTDGTWDAIKACCIMAAWDGLTGALYPLKGPAPTNNNFVSGDYNRETGLLGNGGTKYLDSNRAGNADPQDSNHISIFCTNLSGGSEFYIGSGFLVTGDTAISHNGGSFEGRSRNSTVGLFGSSGSTTGFVGISRNNSTSFIGRSGSTNTTHNVSSLTPNSADYHVFKTNGLGSNGSTRRLSFYSIGESLDLALLDNRVSTLMTDIGAAIP